MGDQEVKVNGRESGSGVRSVVNLAFLEDLEGSGGLERGLLPLEAGVCLGRVAGDEVGRSVLGGEG